MQAKKEERRMISIRLLATDAQLLEKTAARNNVTVSEQLRRFIADGTSVDAYKNDEEKIIADIRRAVREEFAADIERLAKIGIKGSVTSAMSMLLLSLMLDRLTKQEQRGKIPVVHEQGRKLAIRYVQNKEGSLESFLRTATEKICEIWHDGI
jgi:hypothetical protein